MRFETANEIFVLNSFRAAKEQASLRFCADSPEPLLLDTNMYVDQDQD